MKKRFWYFLALLLLLGGGGLFWKTSLVSENVSFLKDHLPKRNRRYATFLQAMDLMTERGAKVLVETGTARGGKKKIHSDGGSTFLFSEWAKAHQATLHSVDINLAAIEKAKHELGSRGESVHFITGDSVDFLTHFNQPIDFLYLDSFDYDKNNPEPSQQHHLKEIKAALPHLHESSVIMIDDCKISGGGKGKLAIDHLLANGWKIERNLYQVILVRK